MTTFRCKNCGYKHTITGADKPRKSSTVCYPAQTTLINDDTLRQAQPIPVPRQLPSLPTWTSQSKTGQRVVQTGVSCGLVAIAGASGQVICTVGLGVWFGSVMFGKENWDVVFRFFDRNNDGRVDSRDLREMTEWWRKGDDKPDAQQPPDLPVQVIRGAQTLLGKITGTTPEQLTEAAQIMFTVINQDKPFSRDRVGGAFGSNFSNVQKEMRKLKLLKGNQWAGYKLTTEGKAFLSRYHSPPSPTPNE